MIWTTDTLPCNGIACSCDKKAIERDKKIKKMLDEDGGYETPFYKNNHNLRAPNILFDYSDYEKNEYVKSRNDIGYFYHQSQKYKRNKLTLYKIQEDTLYGVEKNRFNIIINSEQSGMSYILAIKALYKALMFHDKSILIVSNNRDSSEKILNLIKDLYQTLPFFLKCGILQWNEKQIGFDNGSRIIIGGMNNIIATNWELVILNGFAFYGKKKMEYTYKYLLPTLSTRTNSELIICSVPNGENFFKKIVEEDNFFEKHYIHWTNIPNRDENWKKQQILINGLAVFAQSYENIFFNSKEWNRYNNLESLLNKN